MFLFEGGPQSAREIEAFFNELIGPSAAVEFWKEYRRRYITESDIQLIQHAGLNSVRIPLHYQYFLPGGGGFELLDPALEWCRRADVWVILICTAHLAAKPAQTSTIVGATHGCRRVQKMRS